MAVEYKNALCEKHFVPHVLTGHDFWVEAVWQITTSDLKRESKPEEAAEAFGSNYDTSHK